MANILIKKLRDFTRGGKQIVTTSNVDGTTALYPLSVLQSVFTNESYTVKNIFCGSYDKGTIIPVKTSLHTILTKLLSESNSNVLTTDHIDYTEIPSEPLNTKVPSTKLLKTEVDRLDKRIDDKIVSYDAGNADETGLKLVNSITFSHAKTVTEITEKSLCLFAHNKLGHVTQSTKIEKGDIAQLPQLQHLEQLDLDKINEIITAYNNLVTNYNKLINKLFPEN